MKLGTSTADLYIFFFSYIEPCLVLQPLCDPCLLIVSPNKLYALLPYNGVYDLIPSDKTRYALHTRGGELTHCCTCRQKRWCNSCYCVKRFDNRSRRSPLRFQERHNDNLSTLNTNSDCEFAGTRRPFTGQWQLTGDLNQPRSAEIRTSNFCLFFAIFFLHSNFERLINNFLWCINCRR